MLLYVHASWLCWGWDLSTLGSKHTVQFQTEGMSHAVLHSDFDSTAIWRGVFSSGVNLTWFYIWISPTDGIICQCSHMLTSGRPQLNETSTWALLLFYLVEQTSPTDCVNHRGDKTQPQLAETLKAMTFSKTGRTTFRSYRKSSEPSCLACSRTHVALAWSNSTDARLNSCVHEHVLKSPQSILLLACI